MLELWAWAAWGCHRRLVLGPGAGHRQAPARADPVHLGVSLGPCSGPLGWLAHLTPRTQAPALLAALPAHVGGLSGSWVGRVLEEVTSALCLA